MLLEYKIVYDCNDNNNLYLFFISDKRRDVNHDLIFSNIHTGRVSSFSEKLIALEIFKKKYIFH